MRARNLEDLARWLADSRALADDDPDILNALYGHPQYGMTEAAISRKDIGRHVAISGDILTVDGDVRLASWGGSHGTHINHTDCHGKIANAVDRIKSDVQLVNGTGCQSFSNPASGAGRFIFGTLCIPSLPLC